MFFLVVSLVDSKDRISPDEFFLSFYFAKNYRDHILKLAELVGGKLPYALKIDLLFEKLDSKTILDSEIYKVNKQIKQLDDRINQAQSVSKLVPRLAGKGYSKKQILGEIDNKFPYELNRQKPLSELLGHTDENAAISEMIDGSINRINLFWLPSKRISLRTWQN